MVSISATKPYPHRAKGAAGSEWTRGRDCAPIKLYLQWAARWIWPQAVPCGPWTPGERKLQSYEEKEIVYSGDFLFPSSLLFPNASPFLPPSAQGTPVLKEQLQWVEQVSSDCDVNVVSFYLKYLVLDLAFETMCADDTRHSDGKWGEWQRTGDVAVGAMSGWPTHSTVVQAGPGWSSAQLKLMNCLFLEFSIWCVSDGSWPRVPEIEESETTGKGDSCKHLSHGMRSFPEMTYQLVISALGFLCHQVPR
jgi:hypothetical protein